MAKRRKRKQSSVKLPWEQRTGWLRVFGRSRVALALVAATVIVVGYAFSHVSEARHKRLQTRNTIADVHRAVARFRAEVGRCPHSIRELRYPPRARTTYLRETPRDAWGRPIRVRCPGDADPDAVDVLSSGPSGDFLVDDNVQ